MCSAAPVCPLARPVSFGKDDYSLATLYQTSSRSAEKWGTDSIAKCSQQAATTISLLFSPLNRTPTSPAMARSRAARYYAQREPRFDLLALLPTEISLKILCYLDPRDLSRWVAVDTAFPPKLIYMWCVHGRHCCSIGPIGGQTNSRKCAKEWCSKCSHFPPSISDYFWLARIYFLYMCNDGDTSHHKLSHGYFSFCIICRFLTLEKVVTCLIMCQQ